MGTLADSWRAFLSASLGQSTGSVNDLQKAFTDKYIGGLDGYMGSMLGRRFKTGHFYTFDEAEVDGTLLMVNNELNLVAFTVGTTTTFNQISLEVTAAGAGSTVDVCIMDSRSDGAPGAIIATANLSGAAIAVVTAVIAATLTPGTYWLGAVAHGATPPTVRTKGATKTRFVGQTTGGAANITGWVLAGVAGAPAANPAVIPGTSTAKAKVMLRAA